MTWHHARSRLGAQLLALGSALLITAQASAYPGGPPKGVDEVSAACAGCHVTRRLGRPSPRDFTAGRVAQTSFEHVLQIRDGDGPYSKLTAKDREVLATHVEWADHHTALDLRVPEVVAPGETFEVRVFAAGGAGPVVSIALLDSDQRASAKPATAAGWRFEGEPKIRMLHRKTLPEGQPFHPNASGSDRRPYFVTVGGIDSQAEKALWPRVSVSWTLRAPNRPGDYPLSAVFFYGTETASALGRVADPSGVYQPLGGEEGMSGRVAFTNVFHIRVESSAAKTAIPSETAGDEKP